MLRNVLLLAATILSEVWLAQGRTAEPASPPTTPKKSVTDIYHGVKVTDDYRWLENWDDPAVRKWSAAQNRHARAWLDALPNRAAIGKRVKDLNSDASPDYFGLRHRGAQLFALKFQPPKDQPFLITLRSADEPDSAHVIVDPTRLNPKGTTTIDFYVPSRDGRLVAVSLSEGGSEEGTLHVYEAASGKELGDIIPRVYGGTAAGSAAWNADGIGFYYTRYPRGTERAKEDLNFYQQVYFHKLGTPTASDTYVLGKDFPRIAEITLETSEDGRYLLATVANGDGGEFAHYLHGPSGQWTQLTRFTDKITGAVFGPDETLYLLSRQDAPRGKILRLPLADPKLAEAATVVPESEAAIMSYLPTANRLYVVDLVGGPSQIRVFDRDGKLQKPVPIKPISSVAQLVRLGDGDNILFRNETFIDPPAWYLFEASDGKAVRTKLFRTSAADFSDTEVVRIFAVSKDGTKVPLNILRRKGTKLDGQNPTVLYGYGGYNISVVPRFKASRIVWLEQGGVYAVANLRGGGEYGEAWHHAGNLTRKQNVFDDFIACARNLIDKQYTNPDKLAIEGGSNGGLLMGAALTQQPELFRAVVSHVGIYDMLRVELHPNGAFNVTEFGTVKDAEQFKALFAYSPYHHVKDGTAYPAVLLLTGENDARVDPYHSRKMAARLQAATSSGRLVLLRTSASSGHGVDSSLSERIAEETDVFAFLFDQLGVQYKPISE
jgi:prolyl oligopeptidase